MKVPLRKPHKNSQVHEKTMEWDELHVSHKYTFFAD